ncbi:unnamed protein product, partial [Polarella glacialis]
MTQAPTANARSAKEAASKGQPQTEWGHQRALCALRFHTKLVGLLLEKLDVPLAQLQELRLACKRRQLTQFAPKLTSRCSPGDASCLWRASSSGSLYMSRELQCPIWHRLWYATAGWPSEDTRGAPREPFRPATCCLSREEARIVKEVEVHVSAALRHLGHASSHDHEVGKYFSAELGRASGDAPEESPAEDAHSALQDQEPSEDVAQEAESVQGVPALAPAAVQLGPSESEELGHAAAFGACQERLGEVAWAFFLHVQVVTAIFAGDVVLLAAWAVRMLGLGAPWSLRRLQDFVICALELLADHPEGLKDGASAREASRSLLLDACAAYLSAPVIPRLQARLRSCVSRLRDQGILRPAVDDERLTTALRACLGEVEQPTEAVFDGEGSGLKALRDADGLRAVFRRTLRQAVVGRLDRSCCLEVRSQSLAGVKAVSALHPDPGGAARSRGLMLEALASVPQRPPVTFWSLNHLEVSEENADGNPTAIRKGEVQFEMKRSPSVIK